MEKSNKKYNVCIKNREISFRYDIVLSFECGIELKGTEAKSVKASKCNLKDSFAIIKNGMNKVYLILILFFQILNLMIF